MLKLETRPQPSTLMSIASPLLALAITVVIGTILFALLGKDPVRGLQVFFVEPVRSVYALSELAMKATPLILIALGLAVCFRSNVWNIGAEGQFILGAIFASYVAMQAGPTTGGWIVIAKGRLSPSVATSAATVEMIGEWMSGLWVGAQEANHAQA